MKKLIIFTDIGDTIVNELTEIRPEGSDIVASADLIPGAYDAYRRLYNEGYTIVMVADGWVESFHNTMTQNGLDDIFTARVISKPLGTQKPDARMFQAAMDALALTDADKPRVVMIGNNLERDILGANRFGIRSVHLRWSKKRRLEPVCADEIPTYSIDTPDELPALIDRLESEL